MHAYGERERQRQTDKQKEVYFGKLYSRLTALWRYITFVLLLLLLLLETHQDGLPEDSHVIFIYAGCPHKGDSF